MVHRPLALIPMLITVAHYFLNQDIYAAMILIRFVRASDKEIIYFGMGFVDRCYYDFL